MKEKEIRALIERRRKEWRYGSSIEAKYRAEECDDILELMDEQEEPVSEDFEKALAEEWKGYIDRGAATVDALEDNTQELAFAKGFRRGANWQKEKDDNLFTIAYMDGVEEGKQQMMKDSISATIESDLDPHGADYGNQKIVCEWGELEAKKFKKGTKVKLIIIKED